MKTYLHDLDALCAVSPRALYAYLRSRGWQRIEPYGDVGDIYSLLEGGPELLVPASSEFTDYTLRLSQILEILSSTEQRDSRAILRDLSVADADLIRIRVPETTPDGSMPIERGVALFQESRNLLLAAACSATRPQRVFRAGRIKDATLYLETVRMGQTEQGSFVVNFLSPAPPELNDQIDLFGNQPSQPFARRVTSTLASGLRAARQAVNLANRGHSVCAFEERVQEGVSANLCDALGNLLESEMEIDVSISWALTRKPPEDHAQAYFYRPDVDVLKEASRILKERQERPDERIDGYVTALSRGEAKRQGRVTIKAVIDDVMSSIRADFEPNDYSRIVQAHDNRQIVSLEGDLKRDGQRWVLLNPRDLAVIADDEW